MSESNQPDPGTAGTPIAPPVVTPASGTSASSPTWERDVLEKLAFAALNEQRTARRWSAKC